MKADTSIVLFDGECSFCNGGVRFIIKRDKKARYRFASLQSRMGKELLSAYKVPENIDSIVLLEGNRYYTHSEAALRICRHLGLWKAFYGGIVVPRLLRDMLYKGFAKYRYKMFGKTVCMIPSKEVRARFLEE
ncbi:DCC1-like thiol-disulfide oxidoreductase family protein [Bacillus sp. 165]|uniref:thiol-disulfide oxidoreductase DCC family protein n=1 Tax=Bacillus sp. 165 TaxID=1529117 RepID=UPI001ADB04E8|nr:DCC1-like thiol-disulfide oxidoreductase family protein [Bacillus sp. 165]MBO9130378.1 DUF393 domain-containing protein [Bacillus sp. 165]